MGEDRETGGYEERELDTSADDEYEAPSYNESAEHWDADEDYGKKKSRKQKKQDRVEPGMFHSFFLNFFCEKGKNFLDGTPRDGYV